MKLESILRPIVKGEVLNQPAYFLLDTGTNLPLIDITQSKDYSLNIGNKFPGNIIGAGGVVEDSYYCSTPVKIGNMELSGFVLTDLSSIRQHICGETGINLLGIISYPQMQLLDVVLDIKNNKLLEI